LKENPRGLERKEVFVQIGGSGGTITSFAERKKNLAEGTRGLMTGRKHHGEEKVKHLESRGQHRYETLGGRL